MNKHTKQILIVVGVGIGVYFVYAIVTKFLDLLSTGAHSIGSAISQAITAPFDSLSKVGDAVSNLTLGPDAPNPALSATQSQLDATVNNNSGWNFGSADNYTGPAYTFGN